MPLTIRPMTVDDILSLTQIRPGFTSLTRLVVEKTGSEWEVGWRLVERPLATPYDKGDRYDFDATERASIRQRLTQGDGLHLVVESDQRLVGILDVSPHEWNDTAWMWNLMLDKAIRGQGIGRDLFLRAAAWARGAGYRALMLETQTNNVPACKFYARMGCELAGIHDAYYTNTDMARGEVALFWVYRLV